jgi:NADH:ubiquinone oxidoreductase subunit 3 (subunit A)
LGDAEGLQTRSRRRTLRVLRLRGAVRIVSLKVIRHYRNAGENCRCRRQGQFREDAKHLRCGPKIREKSHWKRDLKQVMIVLAIASMLLALIVFFLFPWDIQNVLGTQVQPGILNLAVLFLIVFLALTFAIIYVGKVYDYIMPKVLERVFNDKEW